MLEPSILFFGQPKLLENGLPSTLFQLFTVKRNDGLSPIRMHENSVAAFAWGFVKTVSADFLYHLVGLRRHWTPRARQPRQFQSRWVESAHPNTAKCSSSPQGLLVRSPKLLRGCPRQRKPRLPKALWQATPQGLRDLRTLPLGSAVAWLEYSRGEQ